MRWVLLALLLFVLWGVFVVVKIRRDNRPGPRWPGDP